MKNDLALNMYSAMQLTEDWCAEDGTAFSHFNNDGSSFVVTKDILSVCDFNGADRIDIQGLLPEDAAGNLFRQLEIARDIPKEHLDKALFGAVKFLREYCDSTDCKDCKLKVKVHCNNNTEGLPIPIPAIWSEWNK